MQIPYHNHVVSSLFNNPFLQNYYLNLASSKSNIYNNNSNGFTQILQANANQIQILKQHQYQSNCIGASSNPMFSNINSFNNKVSSNKNFNQIIQTSRRQSDGGCDDDVVMILNGHNNDDSHDEEEAQLLLLDSQSDQSPSDSNKTCSSVRA